MPATIVLEETPQSWRGKLGLLSSNKVGEVGGNGFRSASVPNDFERIIFSYLSQEIDSRVALKVLTRMKPVWIA